MRFMGRLVHNSSNYQLTHPQGSRDSPEPVVGILPSSVGYDLNQVIFLCTLLSEQHKLRCFDLPTSNHQRTAVAAMNDPTHFGVTANTHSHRVLKELNATAKVNIRTLVKFHNSYSSVVLSHAPQYPP